MVGESLANLVNSKKIATKVLLIQFYFAYLVTYQLATD